MRAIIMPCTSRYSHAQLVPPPIPPEDPSASALRCTSRSFCPTPGHLTPGIGREVLLEVSGCQKCSRHHLMNPRTFFSHSFEVELARINARLLSKLSACVTEIKTSSRFECWRQWKLLNPSFPSFLCPPAYQNIQKAILH